MVTRWQFTRPDDVIAGRKARQLREKGAVSLLRLGLNGHCNGMASFDVKEEHLPKKRKCRKCYLCAFHDSTDSSGDNEKQKSRSLVKVTRVNVAGHYT